MARRAKPKVAVVIPAYNEGKVIAKVISDIQEHFKSKAFLTKIVVVDDGSEDNTVAQAKKARAYVIKHVLNTGSGGATATGLSYAYSQGFDIAVTCDADGQHAAEDVVRGVSLIADSTTDLLIGSRLINSDGMSRVKVLGNWGMSYVTRLLFGIRVTDSQSGLRVFSRQALASLKWKTSGYEFCSEMLWRAKQLDLKIDEFPIKSIYTDYSIAKGQNNWNAVNIIKILLRRRIVELFGE